VAISIDILYSLYILLCTPIQPRIIGYSNVLASLSQALTIILSLSGVEYTILLSVLYIGSISSIIISFIPIVLKFYHSYKRKANTNNEEEEIRLE
jgi:hypothetical protein